ncbi:L-xylulose/3-keto-L-gulonate kinase (plasmid) [Paracoccaceae bacterium]|nr:L-xylulose/3-keto-L-gulonate kinase [Paracoccaceae bacterium]
MAYVLGIDKGTSVIKAVIFDATGTTVGKADRRTEILAPRPGWHEEDPATTWAACCAVIRAALADAGVTGGDITGVGVAAHMGGAWIVDSQGAPVRNAICWPDERAAPELAALEEKGVLDDAFAISGNGLMPGITLLILNWLTTHEPQTLTRASAVLCAKDYLRFRLTGEIATDPSDVSFVPGDIRAQRHSPDLMDMLGAGAWVKHMPPILPSEAIAGKVTAQAAEATGLAPGTPVITGLGDAVANTLGAGRSQPGEAVTILGTSCLNAQILAEANSEPKGLGFLFAMPRGHSLRILPNTSGTLTLDWFLDQFGGPKTPSGAWDFAQLEAQVDAIEPGAGGVLLLPYLNPAGVLAPFYGPRARGAFFGMSRHTTRDHLARAVYEALAYSTRDCFAAMPGARTALTLTGGGARSRVWAQMFADVLNLPVDVTEQEETGALGVALLAGIAGGLWPDLDTAQSATSGVAASYTPDPQRAAEYEGWFALYQDIRDTYSAFSEQRAQLRQAVPA